MHAPQGGAPELFNDHPSVARAEALGVASGTGPGASPTAIIVHTAPPHHPWRGRPLILVGDVEVAWAADPARAELDAEFLRANPSLAADLAASAVEDRQ